MMGSANLSAAPRLPFRKMHGLGNDFVVLDLRADDAMPADAALVRSLADRRRGVGFDQLVALFPGEPDTDAVVRFWNVDGSEAGACGNGTRCVADMLLRELCAERVRLRTSAGVLDCERRDRGDVEVNMGPPRLGWAEVPLAEPRDTAAFPAPSSVGGLVEVVSAVGMGNPHCVLFVADAQAAPVARLGPAIERDPLFPDRANVSFAEIRSQDEIRLRVWERGAGATPACGSAACATLVSAARRGLTGSAASVELDGGILQVRWPGEEEGVRMSGPVSYVFRGEIDPRFQIANDAEAG